MIGSRRRRWWGAAALFWLAAVAASSPLFAVGPLVYAVDSGRVPLRVVAPVLRPLVVVQHEAFARCPALESPVAEYNTFWVRLADPSP